jgi:hypothetical protein
MTCSLHVAGGLILPMLTPPTSRRQLKSGLGGVLALHHRQQCVTPNDDCTLMTALPEVTGRESYPYDPQS